jgi:hypothetical protein
VLTPTVQAAGPDGGRFMLRLSAFGRMSRVLTISAALTVLAGILLYWQTSSGLSGTWLTSAHGITLTIGAIIGILAMLHGIFATGPIVTKMGTVAKDILSRQGPPPPELMQQAQALGARLGSNSMASVAMGALALFFMAGSNYL